MTNAASHIRRPIGARDRTGQERLSTASMALLMHLALRTRPVTWLALESFRASYDLSEDDLLPMVQAGWVERKSLGERALHQRSSFSLLITDRGNEVVRNLVAWAQLQTKEGGAA